MRKELFQRRARLRAKATLQPLHTARRALQSVSAVSPVIPPGSETQQVLEGQFFQAIRTLHYPWQAGPLESLPGCLAILAIVPDHDCLLLRVEPSGAAATVVEAALAHAPRNGYPADVQAPHLRVRDGERGAEFYRLGSPGVIILDGVTFDDIAALHAKHRHHEEMECLWITSPDTATADEEREWPTRREPAYRVTSSVVRRLGLLTRLGASSVDTWEVMWDEGAEIMVEAWFPRLTYTERVRLLRDLSAPHLAPRWHPTSPLEDQSTYPYHYFTVGDTNHVVQIRLFERR